MIGLDGLERACQLTETGDAGSSPHVAKCFFNDVPRQNIAIYNKVLCINMYIYMIGQTLINQRKCVIF